jgi:hypothetical protein
MGKPGENLSSRSSTSIPKNRAVDLLQPELVAICNATKNGCNLKCNQKWLPFEMQPKMVALQKSTHHPFSQTAFIRISQITASQLVSSKTRMAALIASQLALSSVLVTA